MPGLDVAACPIDGAWIITPTVYEDDRGSFAEWFRQDALSDVLGYPLDLQQANVSTSAAGIVRGIHFADVPPGQAKYVVCMTGAVLDVFVDLRLGSPTFGQWHSVVLDSAQRTAVYLAEGLGHAFMSLADGSVVSYLCSTTYAPSREHGVHPLDPDLGIDWPDVDPEGRELTPRLSPKDAVAPTLAQASASGLLPTMAAASAWYADRRRLS